MLNKLFYLICYCLVVSLPLFAETGDYQKLLESAEKNPVKIEKPVISDEMLQKILRIKDKADLIQKKAISEPESFSIQPENRAINKEIQTGESIWLMISSSMPESSIRNYLADIDRYQLPIKVVIRGLVQSDMKKTLQWTQKNMKKNECRDLKKCSWYKASIAIDPLVFRYFQVKRVPALATGDTIRVASEETATKEDLKGVIYGDASIMALLEKAALTSVKAEKAFTQMRTSNLMK